MLYLYSVQTTKTERFETFEHSKHEILSLFSDSGPVLVGYMLEWDMRVADGQLTIPSHILVVSAIGS